MWEKERRSGLPRAYAAELDGRSWQPSRVNPQVQGDSRRLCGLRSREVCPYQFIQRGDLILGSAQGARLTAECRLQHRRTIVNHILPPLTLCPRRKYPLLRKSWRQSSAHFQEQIRSCSSVLSVSSSQPINAVSRSDSAKLMTLLPS